MPYWRKEVNEQDALDQPDFDRLAIQTSRVEPMGSREQYRIGRACARRESTARHCWQTWRR